MQSVLGKSHVSHPLTACSLLLAEALGSESAMQERDVGRPGLVGASRGPEDVPASDEVAATNAAVSDTDAIERVLGEPLISSRASPTCMLCEENSGSSVVSGPAEVAPTGMELGPRCVFLDSPVLGCNSIMDHIGLGEATVGSLPWPADCAVLESIGRQGDG